METHLPGDSPRRLPATAEPVSTAMSGDRVLRLTFAAGPPAYLKVSEGWRLAELRHEHEVLRWLDGRLGAPRVVDYTEADGGSLLLEEIPGPTALHLALSADPGRLMGALARALRRVHALPVESCPFPRRAAGVVAEARRRARDGRVEITHLDRDHGGWTPERLLAALDAHIPPDEDLVFTHGDFCLGNIIVADEEVVGLVDWGRAGVADRYQDIALLLRSFDYNAGDPLEDVFRREYGLAALDRPKLEFYRLLDEFF